MKWKTIYETEGIYSVSNLGLVRNNKTGRILKSSTNFGGYSIVCIKISNKFKAKTVHQLVAIHFIKNTNKYKSIHHKNHITTDNKYTNLEWVNQMKNCRYSVIDGRYKKKLSNIILKQIINRYNKGERQHKLAKEFNVTQGGISYAIKNNKKYQ